MDGFYDKVGSVDAGPFPLCENKRCKRRIVPAGFELNLTILCHNCFEKYVATEEEIRRHAEAIERYSRLRQRRQEYKRKYGRNSKSYDAYEGWCQPKQI